MTKQEMIELAKQSGWEYAHGESGFEPLWAFAKLVAEHEREACANIADSYVNGLERNYSEIIAEKIIARGNHD